MSPLAAYFAGFALVLALLTAVWAASVARRDASLVDRWWGPGFAVVAWSWFALLGASGPRAWLVAALVTIWGVRLGWHITKRNRGHGEDARYTAMREDSPRTFWWTSLFTVFWLQGALLCVVALPLFAALSPEAPRALAATDWAGLTLWGAGFAFEAVGDAQLAAFKRDPANRGRVMDQGLWRYTRHPNYFGDATLWWGFGLLALATPGAWWTLAGPAIMTTLLVRVSGVALLEKQMSRRPGYADYVARTSAFLPLPPRERH
jgi:steroid 5-alpha reductase family enzyme